MTISATALRGVVLLEPSVHGDPRGTFATLFAPEDLEAAGVVVSWGLRCAVSHNPASGTLRGLHLQTAPFAEHKIVSCVAGRAIDVAVDLRPESPTYRQFALVELSADVPRALVIPPGCAHGFMSRQAATTILYHITQPYAPEHQDLVRWNDPGLGIPWPEEPRFMSERDRDCADRRW